MRELCKLTCEQVEEESSVDTVVPQWKLMGDVPGGMFLLDRELGARTYMSPVAEGEAQWREAFAANASCRLWLRGEQVM